MSRALVLIAAVSRNGVIGRGGKLPWHLPDDLARFKALTLDHAIIMGRKTFESIGRPLPRRRNLVISRQPGFSAEGIEVFSSLEGAIEAAYAGGDTSPFVIGGAEIYAAALPLATRLELTEVREIVEGDAFFPPLDPLAWRLVAREEHDDFAFASYVRKPA
jgi:dihydrofolate reductase